MLREVWQSSRFQNASERGHLLGDLPALVIVRNCADRARARKAIGVAGIRSNFLTVVAVREVTFALPQKVYPTDQRILEFPAQSNHPPAAAA